MRQKEISELCFHNGIALIDIAWALQYEEDGPSKEQTQASVEGIAKDIAKVKRLITKM